MKQGCAGGGTLIDRLDGTAIELGAEDIDDLCRIQLADWLDQVSRSGLWHIRRGAYWRMASHLGGNALRDFKIVFGTR